VSARRKPAEAEKVVDHHKKAVKALIEAQSVIHFLAKSFNMGSLTTDQEPVAFAVRLANRRLNTGIQHFFKSDWELKRDLDAAKRLAVKK